MFLALLVLTAAAHVQAQNALSAWTPGVATNYGGVSEGADPNAATYGLSSVSLQASAWHPAGIAVHCTSSAVVHSHANFCLFPLAAAPKTAAVSQVLH